MTAPPRKKRPAENRPESLAKMQTAFASHIRDPDAFDAPGDVEDRRMKIYRDLFFNNIQSLLSSNFPVLRTLYSEEDWLQLVRDFYSEHRCQTPLFPEVAKEFLRYLQDGRKHKEGDPAFLLELAHYEWVELALSLDERDLDDQDADPESDVLEGVPVLSPLAWPLSYRFPVHLIKPEFQPSEAPDEPSHILVYRNRSGAVRFMKLNLVSRTLIDLLKENREATGLEMLKQIADRLDHPDPDRVIAAGRSLLLELQQKDILLGTRR
jgi:hypothetical protein